MYNFLHKNYVLKTSNMRNQSYKSLHVRIVVCFEKLRNEFIIDYQTLNFLTVKLLKQ